MFIYVRDDHKLKTSGNQRDSFIKMCFTNISFMSIYLMNEHKLKIDKQSKFKLYFYSESLLVGLFVEIE